MWCAMVEVPLEESARGTLTVELSRPFLPCAFRDANLRRAVADTSPNQGRGSSDSVPTLLRLISVHATVR